MQYLSLEDKKQASLDALIFFRDFCDSNGVEYYLAFGTLLGAVRHNGFIPWDDDVDILIPRPDYNRLISEFRDPENNFRLVSCETDSDYMFPYAKIENMRTARVSDGIQDSHGIGIDLFPLDGVPSPLGKAGMHFQFKRKICEMFVNRFYYYSRLSVHSFMDRVKRISGQFFLKTGILKCIALWVNSNIYTTEYATSKDVAFTTDAYEPEIHVYKREWFSPSTGSFERSDFCIPKNYDAILTLCYGDYMKLPPEEQRVTTHTDEFVWREL